MTFSVKDDELAELLVSMKTPTRDVIIIVADYDTNGDASMRMLATHDDLDQAIDQIIFVAEQETEECTCGMCGDEDDDQPELPFTKVTLQ